VDDEAITDEDVPVTVFVLTNDSDLNGDALTVLTATHGISGTVVNNDTDVTYTPDADFCGSDSFTYTADDGHGGTDSATVTVNVTCVNDAPVAMDDGATTDEDLPVTIDVPANDHDVDGDPLAVLTATHGISGTVVNNSTDVTYTPDADFCGTDSFRYTVGDGHGGTDTATVSVNVTCENDPPTWSTVPHQVFDPTTTPSRTLDLWLYVSDPDDDPSTLSFSLVSAPPTGAGVTLDDNRYLDIYPSTQWCGYVDITLLVSDPGGLSASTTFRVEVTWSCQGPLPVPGQTAMQGEPIVLDLTPYEPQVGDGSGMLWYATGADHCTIAGAYSEEDVLSFTPDPGFVGEDEVTLHMRYPWGSEAILPLTLAWTQASAPPAGYAVYLPMVIRDGP
jgi:hypothetical protein